MKALRLVVFFLIGLIALFLIMGLILPKTMSVERSTVINASAETIFPYLQYFEKRDLWYPWNKYDPDMKKETVGTDGEEGATYRWEGNRKVGKGEESMVKIQPGERIESKLRFTDPWESESDTYFQLTPGKEGTMVTWGMNSPMPFPWNALSPLMGMKKNIIRDFDAGLAALKQEAEEAEANKPERYNGFEVSMLDMPERYYVGIRSTLPMTDLQAHYAKHFTAIMALLQKKNITPTGAPSGLYYAWDETTGQADMAPAFPVGEKVDPEQSYTTIVIPAGKWLQIDYFGKYEAIAAAHIAMDQYLAAHGMNAGEVVIEEYITDPQTEPDTAKWLTRLYYTVAK